jgi:hypothetical protein
MNPFRDRADLLRTRAGQMASMADDRLRPEFDELRRANGCLQARLTAGLPVASFREAEFSVFSQFGEDGIIQHLIRHVPIEHDTFVEFGVEDYREANTRFLLVKDNWRGLVIDGGTSHVDFLRASGLAWRHEIDATSAFIDRDNIDGLIAAAGIAGDIGLLSIDLDGNDYWVLDRIESVSPSILIVEYNSVLGPEHAVSVPYDPGFVRADAHWSYLYWGASLAALTHAANRKGYALVAGNAAGNNAFFVRRDVLGAIPEIAVEDAYMDSRFRESRSPDGEMTYVSGRDERLALIRDCRLVDVRTGAESTIAEIYGA